MSKTPRTFAESHESLSAKGHIGVTPTFGVPTLIWHLAIWPRERSETISGITTQESATRYETLRQAFFLDVNAMLNSLQRRASYPRPDARSLKQFATEANPRPWERPEWKQTGDRYSTPEQSDLGFVLWWSDNNSIPSPKPGRDAIRISVHASAHGDFVSISFYMDAAKPWNEEPILAGQSAIGDRRKRIFRNVEIAREICEEKQAEASGDDSPPLVGAPILSEIGAATQDDQSLMLASRVLYIDIWDEFVRAFDLDHLLDKFVRPDNGTGPAFAHLRGLILSTSALSETTEVGSPPGSAAAKTFPRFLANGNPASLGSDTRNPPSEPNAALRAFWPFIRRIVPVADQRECIACGVMDWRALYVTALASGCAHEWHANIEDANLRIDTETLPSLPQERSYDGIAPLRYLILTKGGPRSRQVGRIVERINSMNSMRFIALRDYDVIRDASTQIRLHGQELDAVARKWSAKQAEIREKIDDQTEGQSAYAVRKRDARNERLQELADIVENDLINLSAALDPFGIQAVQGLHFRINRSRYYIHKFENLLSSLDTGNIDAWMSYDQFVARGIKPAFDFIDGVGHRLRGLRSRLQAVLEGVETSALVCMTSATRQNTRQLGLIAATFGRMLPAFGGWQPLSGKLGLAQNIKDVTRVLITPLAGKFLRLIQVPSQESFRKHLPGGLVGLWSSVVDEEIGALGRGLDAEVSFPTVREDHIANRSSFAQRVLLSVGQRIRNERHRRGWTLSQLAETADTTPTQLSLCERGSGLRGPTLELIARILWAFDEDCGLPAEDPPGLIDLSLAAAENSSAMRSAYTQRSLLEFGAWVRKSREATDRTLTVLAARAGTTAAQLSLIERGLGRRGPTADLAARIAWAICAESARSYEEEFRK